MFKTIMTSIVAIGFSAGLAFGQTAAVLPPAPAATDPVDAAVGCLEKAGLTSGTEADARASRVHFTILVAKTAIGTEERRIAFARGVRQVPTLKPAIDDCMKGFGAR